MTGKAVQDLSPSAILFLSIGLLIGTQFMPATEPTKYNESLPILQETTVVDVSEGRLLDRSAENSESTMDKVWHSQSQIALADAVPDIEELRNFFYESGDETLPPVPDSFVVFVVVACAAFGMVLMKVDIQEMEEEYRKAPAAKDNSPRVPDAASKHAGTNSNYKGFQLEVTFVAPCIALVALLIVASPVSFVSQYTLVTSAPAFDELTELSYPFALKANPTIPDNIVVLMLGLVTTMGLVIMRTDVSEMEEEMSAQSKFKADLADAVAVATSSCSSSTKVSKIPNGKTTENVTNEAQRTGRFRYMIIAAVCAVAICMLSCLSPPDVSVTSTTFTASQSTVAMDANMGELRSLHHASMQDGCPAIPDSMVLLVIAVGCAFGIAVMKTDSEEMATDYHEGIHPKCEDSLVSEAAQTIIDSNVYQLGSKYVITCIAAICTLAVALLVLFAVPHFIFTLDSALDASMQELQDLSCNSISNSAPRISDQSVGMLLGLGAMLGLVIMRIDASELAKLDEQDNRLEINLNLNSREAADEGVSSHATAACKEMHEPRTADVEHASHFQCITIPVATAFVMVIGILVSSSVTFGSAATGTVLHDPSTEELRDLQARSMYHGLSLVPDSLVVLMLAACTAFGMIIMKIDAAEMAEEYAGSSELLDVSLGQKMRDTSDVVDDSYRYFDVQNFALAIGVLVAGLLAFVLRLQGIAEFDPALDTGMQELRLLSAPARHASLPDSAVWLMLAACATFGLMVMNADAAALAEEMCESSELKASVPQQDALSRDACCSISKVAENVGTARPDVEQQSLLQCLGNVVLAAPICAVVLFVRLLPVHEALAFSPSLDTSLVELSNLYQSGIQRHLPFVPDRFMLLLVLAASVLGMLIMSADVCEMVDECKKTTISEGTNVKEHSE